MTLDELMTARPHQRHEYMKRQATATIQAIIHGPAETCGAFTGGVNEKLTKKTLAISLAKLARDARLTPEQTAVLFDQSVMRQAFEEAIHDHRTRSQSSNVYLARDPKAKVKPLPSVEEGDTELERILRQHAPEALGLPRSTMALPPASDVVRAQERVDQLEQDLARLGVDTD